MRRIIACCILMALVLSGCGTTVPEEPAEARAGYQILTDCAGRQVEVPLEPARVAALDSFAGEVMVMVGAGARMVAAPNGVKSDYILQCIYPALPEVSAPMSDATINAESLLATAPDLVLLKSAMYQSEGERAKLDKLDIPYLVIGYESMEEQIYALDLIGEALGGTARQTAGEISGYYRETVALAASLRDQVRAQGPLRVYHAISEATRTDGAQTLGNDWLQCVGVENVSAGERVTAAERDYAASLEQIYTWDPDVIICNEADTVPYLRSSDKWAGLRAVREGEVYNIPVGATRWGHRGSVETYFAILWMGTTFFPEIYEDVDLKTEVCTFYEDILGVTLDDALYKDILDGYGIRNKPTGNAGE